MYREANVTIREGFDRMFLSWMYGQLRENFQVTKKKSLTGSHLELYRLVQKSGAPKGKGTVSFWKQVQSEWNQVHPEAEYTIWKGAKIAYDRLEQRLRNPDADYYSKVESMLKAKTWDVIG